MFVCQAGGVWGGGGGGWGEKGCVCLFITLPLNLGYEVLFFLYWEG